MPVKIFFISSDGIKQNMYYLPFYPCGFFIYMEAMKTLSEEIESLFNRTLASVRDDIHPTDDGQSERSCSGFPKSLKS